jgi:LPS-assembly lipoprotein
MSCAKTPLEMDPRTVDQTRRLGLRLACALLAGPLTGCGFALKRTPEMPFRAIQLSGFAANSPFEFELRTNINGSANTVVVDSAAQAQVILMALADRRERSVVGTSTYGLVNTINLRLRFKFSLRTFAGRELIAPTELVLLRDMAYSESDALAKEQEEASIYQSLQSDIIKQVMRRLAASPAP